MTIIAVPSADYEGLRRQFLALRTLAEQQELSLSHYRAQHRDQTQAQADLEGERTTNAQLTEALAEAERQRDILAQAIGEAVVRAGIIRPGVGLSGPQLLQFLDDLVDYASSIEADAKRYRHLVDPEVPGSIRQIGIVHRDNEACWLAGDEACAAIDADMAPPLSDDIPDFSPGNSNRARRRAAALNIDLDASIEAGSIQPMPRTWREIAEPVPEADRLCHTPQCWCCEGTGRDPSGGLCTMNDQIPF